MKDTGDALGRKLNTTKARHSHEVRDEALTGEPAGVNPEIICESGRVAEN